MKCSIEYTILAVCMCTLSVHFKGPSLHLCVERLLLCKVQTPRSASEALSAQLQPSEALHAYFKACDEDVTATVVKRAQELSNAIFPLPSGPTGVAFLQSTMARERRLEVCFQLSLF